MARRGWMAGAVGLVVVGGLGGPGVPRTVAAQAAPVLAVAPLRVDPGDTYTATVTGCDEAPVLFSSHSDVIVPLNPVATGTPGEWTASVVAGGIDGDERVSGTCGDVELEAVDVDVELPYLGFQPQGAFLPPVAVPTTVFGTDCPDGTTATVVLTPDDGDPLTTTGIAIDGFGDWQLGLPTFVAGTEVAVEASCGDLTYAALAYVLPDPVVEPPTTSTTPTAPVPTTVPPAVPRAGTPTFTG